MTLPTSNIRVAVKQAIYGYCLAGAPTRLDGTGPVQVLYAPSGDIEDEVILLGPIQGERTELPLIGTSPRTHRDDLFALDVICSVRTNLLAAEDQIAADSQAAAMAAVVENALAESPGLGAGGGWDDTLGGVVKAWTWIDTGPGPSDLTEAGLGVWSSTCIVKVEVHARLR